MMRSQWFQDGSRSRFNVPPLATLSVTAKFLILLVALYLLQLGLPLDQWLALDSDRLANPLQWYRFLTYSLVHARQDVLHIVFNAMILWFFGRRVESYLGARSYIAFCAGAALAGSLVFLAVQQFRGGGFTMFGASGIVTAALVAFAVLWPHEEVIFIVVRLRAWVLAALLIGMDLYMSLAVGDAGVARSAHLGGAAFGFLAIRYRGRIGDWLDHQRARRAAAIHRHQVEQRQQLDRLLDKINTSGLNSLSKAERRFLDETSRELRGKK